MTEQNNHLRCVAITTPTPGHEADIRAALKRLVGPSSQKRGCIAGGPAVRALR